MAGYLSLLFALLSREVSRGAVCDAGGAWHHLSDGSHVRPRHGPCSHPRLSALASRCVAPLRGDQWSPPLDMEIRSITPERKQLMNIVESGVGLVSTFTVFGRGYGKAQGDGHA